MEDKNKMYVEIKGMHCPSCEVLIERALRKLPGVDSVEVNHASGKAKIHYTQKPSHKDIHNAIREHGYSVSEFNASESNNMNLHTKNTKDDYANMFLIFVAIIGIYALIRTYNIGSSLGISDNMSYLVVFFIGIVASVSSCMAVTGGLLLAVSSKYNESYKHLTAQQRFKPHIYFNIGRIVSYTLLGGLLGLLGSVIKISTSLNTILIIVVGLIMIVLGFQLLNLFPWMRHFQIKMPKFLAHKIHDASDKQSKSAPFLFGSLTFFLPCGFTQALQLFVLSKGSFTIGALTMLSFSIGTLPGLISLGAISSFAKSSVQKNIKQITGVFVIVLGVASLLNVSAITDYGVGTEIPTNTVSDNSNVKLIDGKQIVEMKVIGFDYSPNSFTIVQGVPVEWRVDGRRAQGCAKVITLPDAGITEYLSSEKVSIFNFVPKKTGVMRFSCTMWMAGPGQFNVIANTEQIVPAATDNPDPVINLAAETNEANLVPTVTAPIVQNGVQNAKLSLINFQYTLEPRNLKKGIPVRIVVDASTLGGCMKTVVIPEFGVRKYITPSDNIIEFTPNQEGTFVISCSMGMGESTFGVTVDGSAPTGALAQVKQTAKAPSCGSSGGCGCG